MRNFVNYNEVMRALSLSTHINQLSKRAARYPDHFVEIDGVVYVSSEYIDALMRYKEAKRVFERMAGNSRDVGEVRQEIASFLAMTKIEGGVPCK